MKGVVELKKKIGVLGMMLVLTSAILAGCGGKEQVTDSSQKISAEQEDISLLKDMEEINTLDSMVERNGRVFYTLKEIMADGTDVSYTVYQDQTRYVEVDQYGILIEENGDVYGMDIEQDDHFPFHALFIGDAYEDFMENYKVVSIYGYDEREKIISNDIRDGVIYLETEIPKESVEEYYTAYGYTSDEVDYILSEYEIDSETKEILDLKVYMVSGEKKMFCSEVILDRECEEYVPDKEITDGVFGDDLRTLYAVVDAGTADEKTYTQTVTRGNYIVFYIPEEYEEELYADAECTEEAEIDSTKDQKVYLKRIAK